MIEVLINNETGFQCDEAQLRKVVTAILADHDIADAEVSLAIIDDSTMHVLNRDHLQHDYPTDVLRQALESAYDSGVQTQTLWELMLHEGRDVHVVEGEDANHKLTTEQDWAIMQQVTFPRWLTADRHRAGH